MRFFASILLPIFAAWNTVPQSPIWSEWLCDLMGINYRQEKRAAESKEKTPMETNNTKITDLKKAPKNAIIFRANQLEKVFTKAGDLARRGQVGRAIRLLEDVNTLAGKLTSMPN